MSDVNKLLTHLQRQALATQQLIVDTARTLFLAHGFAATTIEAISAQAGVGVSTVYAIYKNKRGILKAIREAWHDESGLRDLLTRALAEPDANRRIEIAARATRRQWETGAEMMAIYTSAAAVDTDSAAELEQALAGRRAATRRLIDATAPLLQPRLTAERATAIYLALTRPELYQELVGVAGWSPDDYEAWLAQILKQALLG